MTSKIQHIVDLSVHAARMVVEHPDRWADFLSTAAWNYKYPFQDQLLIYAQRPDATACASIDVWNKRLNRWVKRGAKGIALIEDRGNHFGLRHVFDISDTQSRDPRPVSLWRMEPGDIAVVTETLNNAFGEQEPDAAWPNALLSAARNTVDDNSSDYVDLLVRELEGSLLEELERQPVEVLFRQIAYHSVAYMALTRCGMNASHYIGREDLSGIGNFNTLPALSQLGAAISDIAEMMLREIESTIRVQRRVERQTSQARDVRTVARETALTQNEAKRLPERTDEHGSDLHPSRGLSAARPDTDRGSSTDRQVWDVAQKLPENREERHIRQPAALGRTAPASDGNRPVGADAARTDDERTAPSAPGPGQSERSAGLDGLHEQPEATGGGDHSDGTDLQLKWYDRKTEDRSLPFFHDHNAINDLLRTAPLLKSKSEIEAFFAAHENEGERALYVRSLFAPGQSELTLDEDLLIGYEPYRNVLHLWTGPATEPTAQSFYDWEVIAGHINSMIVLNEFDPARKTEPSVQQQTLFMEQAEADTASAFVWPQAVIDAILQQGSGFANSKYRIALHFQQSLSAKENAEFLKREYGTGGRAPVLIGTDIYEHHDSKGITLTRRSMTDQEQKLVLPWMKVQKRIGELLAAGRYLNRLETERLPAFAEQQEERHRQMAEEESARERLEQEQPSSSQQSETMDRKQARYAYAPGDTVFFGADEYEILLVENGNVMLRDVHFPLFTKELERRDFERILRENPLNDHLLTDEQGVETEAEEPAEEEMEPELSDGDEPKSASASLQLTEQVSDEAHNEESASSAPSAVEDVRSVAPQTPAVNYRITDDQLGHGGAKVKYGFNVAAIRLLKQLEQEERQATADEQVVLARYVGWGGIPQAFDEANTQWTAEYAELQSLLEPDEYASARASTLNAHYTSPVVIKAIYGCLERMGFCNGNILEPSCGIGNFFGLVPESFQDSQLFGVELDSITGRIAKQLYPQATIAISGYEETTLPDSFFDLAIGNVPFGGYGVADKRYDKHKFLIHDYFFAKTLDKVRPGGIIAFITSKGTMDKQNPAVRKYIAERAELLGAVRLPNNAFQSNAGTEVTADILFLQKRDRMVTVTEQSVEWIGLAETAEGVPINAYFATHPDMVLGTMAFDDRMYGNRQETTCNPYPDANLSELLGEALTNIHADWVEFEREVMPDEEDTSLPADPTVRNFSYTLVDGQLYYRENSRMHRVDTSATAAGRIKGMIRLRDTVRELIEYQTEDYSDEEIRE